MGKNSPYLNVQLAMTCSYALQVILNDFKLPPRRSAAPASLLRFNPCHREIFRELFGLPCYGFVLLYCRCKLLSTFLLSILLRPLMLFSISRRALVTALIFCFRVARSSRMPSISVLLVCTAAAQARTSSRKTLRLCCSCLHCSPSQQRVQPLAFLRKSLLSLNLRAQNVPPISPQSLPSVRRAAKIGTQP